MAYALYLCLINISLQHLGVVVFAVLHAVPAVGIFVITSLQLAFAVKSPVVAISIIILCFLPIMIAIFYDFYMTIFGASTVEPSNIPI